MSYRDDLNAAHTRIASLERELAECKGKPADGLADYSGYSHASALAMMRQRAVNRPLVQQLSPSKVKTVPILFSAKGEAGSMVNAVTRAKYTFRGDEMFAFDTSTRPGHGTEIVEVYAGSERQGWDAVPTWMFYEWLPFQERALYERLAKLAGTPAETEMARFAANRLRFTNAAKRLPWGIAPGGLDVTFVVKFIETCKWEAVLWASVLQ